MSDVLFDDVEIEQVRADVMEIVRNEHMGGSLIYHSFTGHGNFDPSTGAVGKSYAGTWINAARRAVTMEEIDESEGAYRLGDDLYTLSVEQVDQPKKADRLEDGTRTKFIIKITTDSIRTFHTLVCRDV